MKPEIIKLVASEGKYYTNKDYTVFGKEMYVLKGYEDWFFEITEQEKEEIERNQKEITQEELNEETQEEALENHTETTESEESSEEPKIE